MVTNQGCVHTEWGYHDNTWQREKTPSKKSANCHKMTGWVIQIWVRDEKSGGVHFAKV